MNQNKNTTTPKELLNDLQGLVKEAESMISGAVSDYSEDAVESLRSRFLACQEQFNTAYANARKKVVAGARYTDETIRANPYQSLAIAAGVGLIIGVLVSRRSR